MKDPKHVLITGASSGIGAALAKKYAASDVILSLHGRDRARLERVASEAQALGADASVRIGDVCDASDMAAWIAERDGIRPLDLVFANAGISGGTARIEDLTDLARTTFEVNVTGVFNTIHPVLPLMAARGKGQVAILSSLASFRGFAGSAAYCASKAAVRVYAEGLRAEMAPRNVEVTVICPGFIKTPMTDVNPFKMPFLMSPERAARLIHQGLVANRARIAFPWQMYGLVRLLASLPQGFVDFVEKSLPKKE